MLTSKLRNTGKFVVIGDLILDRYIFCTPNKISPEAPILVMGEESREILPGGAANVACKLHNLNYDVALCGIVGEDTDGILLTELLAQQSIDVSGVVVSGSRPTTVKTRIVASGQQVLRTDKESCAAATPQERDRLIDAFNSHTKRSQGVALIDYMKGTLSDNVLSGLDHRNRSSIVDPRGSNWERYGEVTVIKPNLRELGVAVGHEVAFGDIGIAGRTALTYCKAHALLVTLSADGMMVIYKDKPEVLISTAPTEVFDVTGAGDAVSAAVLAGLASGMSLEECSQLGNFAGSAIVCQRGVGMLSRSLLSDVERQAREGIQ